MATSKNTKINSGGSGGSTKDELQLAIENGDVEEPENEKGLYHCKLCDQSLKTKQTMKNHLSSQKHKNQLCGESSKKSTPATVKANVKENNTKLCKGSSKTPLETDKVANIKHQINVERDTDSEKDVLEEAIEYGEVQEPKYKNGPYYCTLCDKELKTKQTIRNHLDTQQHINQLELDEEGVQEDDQINVESDTDSEKDALEEAIEYGVIQEPKYKNGPYYCTLCDKELKTKQTIRNHLNTQQHINQLESDEERVQEDDKITGPSSDESELNIVEQAFQDEVLKKQKGDSEPFFCTVCLQPLKQESRLKNHLKSKKHLSKAQSENEIEKAVLEGYIIQESTDSQKSRCSLCNRSFQLRRTLKVHLNSRKHLLRSGKATSFNENQCVSLSNKDQQTQATKLKSVMETPVESQDKNDNEDMRKSGAKKTKDLNITSSSTTVSAYVMKQESKGYETAKTPQSPKKKYSVTSDTRGHVYIFNYTFKGTQKRRRGAEHDSNNLRDTFSRMGYKVYVHEDLTGDETNEALDKIQKKPELKEIDSFIMCILSHGLNEYTFLANDKDEMNLQLIRRKFTDRKCPSLRGKPKIFFVNYCRGDQTQKKEIEYDGISIEVPNDMVTIHAATEGIMALRNPTSGSIFVASLCEVLNARARELDLRGIYHELEDKMKERHGTKPMWEDYGFKPFFFNPI